MQSFPNYAHKGGTRSGGEGNRYLPGMRVGRNGGQPGEFQLDELAGMVLGLLLGAAQQLEVTTVARSAGWLSRSAWY